MSRARPAVLHIGLLFPIVLLLTGACAVFEPEPLERERRELSDARARWVRQDLQDYEFTYRAQCTCIPELTQETVIRVRDGQVDSVWFVGGGAPQLVGEASYPTIDALFDRLEAAYAEPTAVVRATFDATRGFPRDAYMDVNRAADYDEYGFVVRTLAAERVEATSQ